MADSTVIKSLRLRNFLSFGPNSEAVPLGPLNILIGRNGSGKSNFLHAFGILQSIPTDVSGYLRGGNTFNEWFWKSEKASDGFTFEVDLNLTPLGSPDKEARYELTVREYEGSPEIAEQFTSGREQADTESIRDLFGADDRRRWRTLSILAHAQAFEDRVASQAVSKAFDSIELLRDFTFGTRSPVRQPQRSDLPRHRLLEDGSNLGLILNGLRQAPVAKQRFLDELNRLYDGISDFDVRIFEGLVQVTVQEGDLTIPATRLSDGTLRYLSMLAVLCTPKPPPIICIEEPELGLHPDILPSIARLLVDASQRSQIIVTTHSDILVDALSDHPKAVLVCDKEEDRTFMMKLEPEKLKVWLKTYRLGSLWLSGEIGGTRW
jgi:predicted ATPase